MCLQKVAKEVGLRWKVHTPGKELLSLTSERLQHPESNHKEADFHNSVFSHEESKDWAMTALIGRLQTGNVGRISHNKNVGNQTHHSSNYSILQVRRAVCGGVTSAGGCWGSAILHGMDCWWSTMKGVTGNNTQRI